MAGSELLRHKVPGPWIVMQVNPWSGEPQAPPVIANMSLTHRQVKTPAGPTQNMKLDLKKILFREITQNFQFCEISLYY
jgi:hypothetical protein